MTNEDFVELLVFLNKKKEGLLELGGSEKWGGLDTDTQAAHQVKLMEDLKEEMGREVYGALLEETRKGLNLFIWAGFCIRINAASKDGPMR